MGLHKILFTSITTSALLLSVSAQGASTYAPMPGSYRPTEGQPTATATPRFNPSSNRNLPAGNYIPTPPPRAYPAPNYNNNNNQFSTPSFNMNPNNMMNSMFNNRNNRGNNNLPYGYPALPNYGAVAPVYDPPLPSVNPGWNNYQSPASTPAYNSQQPTNAQYWQQQPATNQDDTYGGAVPSTQSSYPTQPEASATTGSAPRPFSNPQETGSAFVQRQGKQSFGQSDGRFRPPELKGTP